MKIPGDQVADEDLCGEYRQERNPESLAQREPGDGVDHRRATGENDADGEMLRRLPTDIEDIGGDSGDAEEKKDAQKKEGDRDEREALPVGLFCGHLEDITIRNVLPKVTRE